MFPDFSKCGVNHAAPQQINDDVGDWPWMASLGYWSAGHWNHKCGATLISQTQFITAAQCVRDDNDQLIDRR